MGTETGRAVDPGIAKIQQRLASLPRRPPSTGSFLTKELIPLHAGAKVALEEMSEKYPGMPPQIPAAVYAAAHLIPTSPFQIGATLAIPPALRAVGAGIVRLAPTFAATKFPTFLSGPLRRAKAATLQTGEVVTERSILGEMRQAAGAEGIPERVELFRELAEKFPEATRGLRGQAPNLPKIPEGVPVGPRPPSPHSPEMEFSPMRPELRLDVPQPEYPPLLIPRPLSPGVEHPTPVGVNPSASVRSMREKLQRRFEATRQPTPGEQFGPQPGGVFPEPPPGLSGPLSPEVEFGTGRIEMPSALPALPRTFEEAVEKIGKSAASPAAKTSAVTEILSDAQRKGVPLDPGDISEMMAIIQGKLPIRPPPRFGKHLNIPQERVLSSMGLGVVVRMTRRAENGIADGLKKWGPLFRDALKIGGAETGNEADRVVFDILDNALTREELAAVPSHVRAAAFRMRSLMNEAADDLGIPPEARQRISDYITHLVSRSDDDLVRPELAQVMADSLTGVRNPLLDFRTDNPNYIHSATLAIRAFLGAGLRDKWLHQPTAVLVKLLDQTKMPEASRVFTADFLRLLKGEGTYTDSVMGSLGRNLSRAQLGLVSTLQKLHPESGMLNNMRGQLERDLQRGLLATGRETSGRIRQLQILSALGGSPGAAVENAFGEINTFAEVGLKGWMRGHQLLGRYLRGDPRLKSAMQQSRLLDDASWMEIERDIPTNIRKVFLDEFGEVAMIGFRVMEQKNRLNAFFAGYDQALQGGLSEGAAIIRGRELARITQFGYDLLGTPQAFATPGGKLLGALASFPFRQVGFMSRGTPEEIAKRMLRYTMAGASLELGARQMGFSVIKSLMPLYPDPDGPMRLEALDSIGMGGWSVGLVPRGFGSLVSGSVKIGQLIGRGRPGAAAMEAGSMLLPGSRAARSAFRAIKEGTGIPGLLEIAR